MELEQLTFEPATLGEGPCWHSAEQVLYWIDILGKALHRFDPASGDDRAWQMDAMIGTVAPRANGGMLVALEKGFALFDPEAKRLQPWDIIDESPLTRFNDGKCDPAGRFWCGSMDLQEEQALGTLYCMAPDRTVRPMLENVSISNGMGWSPDRKIMYYIDSPTRQISAFDYDLPTGNIGNRRPVIELTGDAGWPDGMTMDDEGKIWLAHWAGARVCRWDPQTSTVLERHDIPAPHTSACCFGGNGLHDLYVTTARKGLSPEQLEEYPQSGCLFRLKTTVTGSETFSFAG